MFITTHIPAEPLSPHASHEPSAHKSTTDKIKDAVTKPFHKEKETPPKLQEAINVMEARKEETAQRMEAQGKDSSVLNANRKDVMKEVSIFDGLQGFAPTS